MSNRLPGVYTYDREMSTIPEMPGARLVTIVGPFMDGPIDRAFLVSAADYSKILGSPVSLKTGTPHFSYLAVESTLKEASVVQVVRVCDSINAIQGTATSTAGKIIFKTKNPTELYNTANITLTKNAFYDTLYDFRIILGSKVVEEIVVSINPNDENYLGAIGSMSDILYCTSLDITEITTATPTPEAPSVLNASITGGKSGHVVATADYVNAMNLINDRETTDPFLILVPDVVSDVPTYKAVESCIAERGGDCKAVLSTPNTATTTEIVSTASTFNNKYIEFIAGHGIMYDPHLRKNIAAPVATVYGRTFLASQKKSEYGAVAGLLRGQLYEFVGISHQFTKAERTQLQKGRISAIIEKSGGIFIWDILTSIRTLSVFADGNVTTVDITIKKGIGKVSEGFVFEDNSPNTWNKWKSSVRPILEEIKKAEGVYDYQILMGIPDGTMTPADIDTNRMPGIVRYKPTRTSKFVDIYLVAYSYGVEFSS